MRLFHLRSPLWGSCPARRALAASTRRAYLGHWAAFGDWCGRHGYAPAPAAAETVAAHLTAMAFRARRGAVAKYLENPA